MDFDNDTIPQMIVILISIPNKAFKLMVYHLEIRVNLHGSTIRIWNNFHRSSIRIWIAFFVTAYK